MTGERWADKRARAVLFAGANRTAKDDPAAAADPDALADTGLQVRELLFTDDEVREENADTKAHRIGYNADCMQYATVEPAPEGVLLSLWVGTERVGAATASLGAVPHPNALRKMYGWIQVVVPPGGDVAPLAEWVQTARRHAAETKAKQQVSM